MNDDSADLELQDRCVAHAAAIYESRWLFSLGNLGSLQLDKMFFYLW